MLQCKHNHILSMINHKTVKTLKHTKTQRPRIQVDLQVNLYTIRSTRDVMSISILCDYN